jgi:hypothetical protein
MADVPNSTNLMIGTVLADFGTMLQDTRRVSASAGSWKLGPARVYLDLVRTTNTLHVTPLARNIRTIHGLLAISRFYSSCTTRY